MFGEPDGFVADRPDSAWSPWHVIVTRDGNYVSLDAGTGLLAKHDAQTGALIWQRRCGVDDTVGDVIGRPAEAPDGRLYVPGGDLRTVLVLSAEGEPLAAFGRFGSAPGRMVLPVGVAFGPAGEVLVLDRLRAKILVLRRGSRVRHGIRQPGLPARAVLSPGRHRRGAGRQDLRGPGLPGPDPGLPPGAQRRRRLNFAHPGD